MQAAKSSGPRTKAGRSKASQNARWHGLNVALCREPGPVDEIDGLAQAIVIEAVRPDLIDYARRIAEAEIDLRRVQRACRGLERLPTAISAGYRMVASRGPAPRWRRGGLLPCWRRSTPETSDSTSNPAGGADRGKLNHGVRRRRSPDLENRMISLRCLASPHSPIAQTGHSGDSHSRTNGRAW